MFRVAIAKWRANNPGHHEAALAVNSALKRGILKKPDNCTCCGKQASLDGHHNSYDKPLEVEWLCRVCHKTAHRAAITS